MELEIGIDTHTQGIVTVWACRHAFGSTGLVKISRSIDPLDARLSSDGRISHGFSRSNLIFRSHLAVITACMAFVYCCSSLSAEEIFQFRGPNGDGVYSEHSPKSWNDDSNVRWSVDVPGGGWSSPVVAGDFVFVTTAVAEGDVGPKGFGEGVQSMGSFFVRKHRTSPIVSKYTA